MHLLGFVLDLDGPGAATATIVVGVTAEAELKSLDGLAAHKGGFFQFLLSLSINNQYQHNQFHWSKLSRLF